MSLEVLAGWATQLSGPGYLEEYRNPCRQGYIRPTVGPSVTRCDLQQSLRYYPEAKSLLSYRGVLSDGEEKLRLTARALRHRYLRASAAIPELFLSLVLAD